MKRLKFLIIGAFTFLTACSSVNIQTYADKKPELDIRNYLNGDLEAWGIFFHRSGKADPSFHVDIKGSWRGNVGTLEEHFIYSDGKKQDRTWTIVFSDDHHFTATAGDVIGQAKGVQYGNAANMNYVLALDVGDSNYHMSMEDWLYLMDDKTVINRTQMRKFGFKAGELVITFRKK